MKYIENNSFASIFITFMVFYHLLLNANYIFIKVFNYLDITISWNNLASVFMQKWIYLMLEIQISRCSHFLMQCSFCFDKKLNITYLRKEIKMVLTTEFIWIPILFVLNSKLTQNTLRLAWRKKIGKSFNS